MRQHEHVSWALAELSKVRAVRLSGQKSLSTKSASPMDRADFLVVREALAMYSCILLDVDVPGLSFMRDRPELRGRWIAFAKPYFTGLLDSKLFDSLAYLDSVAESLTTIIGAHPFGFKAQGAQKHARRLVVEHPHGHITAKAFWSFAVKLYLDDANFGEIEEPRNGRLAYFGVLRQLSVALKKLPINRSDLLPKMLADYELGEERLTKVAEAWSTSDNALQWIEDLRALATKEFADFHMDYFCPRHGPGAVFTPRVTTLAEKYRDMKWLPELDSLLCRTGLGSWGKYSPFGRYENSELTTRFIAVPKTWKSLRGISAEPAELQFAQQAVRYALTRYLCSSPFWRKRIDLNDQKPNQVLAKSGSETMATTTIDLSQASDSVSLTLVKEVFRDTTVLPWLLATRSHSVYLKPGSPAMLMEKFAPMGSSTCFPVETILFTLIAEVARRRTRAILGHDVQLTPPRVYGDDIICASSTLPDLEDGLETLGFTVNTTKSFTYGFFRESCGKEYLLGHDVTPMYLRVKEPVDGRMRTLISGEAAEAIVAFYNECCRRGYVLLKHYVGSQLKRVVVTTRKGGPTLSDLLPRNFSGDHGCLISSAPTNFHLKTRWRWLDHPDLRKETGKAAGYQTIMATKVTWVLRPKICSLESARTQSQALRLALQDEYGEILTHDWLVKRLRPCDGVADPIDVFSRVPIDMVLVPSIVEVPSQAISDFPVADPDWISLRPHLPLVLEKVPRGRRRTNWVVPSDLMELPIES